MGKIRKLISLFEAQEDDYKNFKDEDTEVGLTDDTKEEEEDLDLEVPEEGDKSEKAEVLIKAKEDLESVVDSLDDESREKVMAAIDGINSVIGSEEEDEEEEDEEEEEEEDEEESEEDSEDMDFDMDFSVKEEPEA